MPWWAVILWIIVGLIAIGVVAIAAFYIYESAVQGTAKSVPDNVVEARGFQFVPNTLNVKKGTRVCWKNLSSSPMKHNVVQIDADSCSAPITRNGFTSGPPSGVINEYCYVFDQPGTFYYKCVPHCLPFLLSMRGKVVVAE